MGFYISLEAQKGEGKLSPLIHKERKIKCKISNDQTISFVVFIVFIMVGTMV